MGVTMIEEEAPVIEPHMKYSKYDSRGEGDADVPDNDDDGDIADGKDDCLFSDRQKDVVIP